MTEKIITELTPEQEEKMPQYVDKWIKIGTSCEPMDKEKARKGALLAYERAGQELPKYIFFVQSPLELAWCFGVTNAILTMWEDHCKSDTDRAACIALFDAVVSDGGLFESDIKQLGLDVKALPVILFKREVLSAFSQLYDQMQQLGIIRLSETPITEKEFRISINRLFADFVGVINEEITRDTANSQIGAMIYGQHESWLAFYDFMNREVDIDTELLDGLYMLAESAGWWIPYTDVAFISDRHREVHRDSEGRLHNPTGACVAYPDEFSCYAIHGVRIPIEDEYIITNPEKITVEKIDAQRNAEIRRVMVERYGLERYVKDGKFEVVHEDELGILYRRHQEDDEDIMVVNVINSTPEPDGTYREYFLRVDPELRPMLGKADDGQDIFGEPQKLTVRNAIASTFCTTGENYYPEIET